MPSTRDRFFLPLLLELLGDLAHCLAGIRTGIEDSSLCLALMFPSRARIMINCEVPNSGSPGDLLHGLVERLKGWWGNTAPCSCIYLNPKKKRRNERGQWGWLLPSGEFKVLWKRSRKDRLFTARRVSLSSSLLPWFSPELFRLLGIYFLTCLVRHYSQWEEEWRSDILAFGHTFLFCRTTV